MAASAASAAAASSSGASTGDEPVTVASTRSRSPGNVSALGHRDVGQLERVADAEIADVDVDVVDEGRRQAEDRDLVGRLLEHAAVELDAARLADQVDRRARLDRLVEPDREQVDVDHAIADRVELELLEDRGHRGLLTGDLHVEHGVAPRLSGQRLAQHRLVATANEEGWRPAP